TGKHLIWASQNYFVILALDETKKEFQVVGQGNGCFQDGEKITAVLCLPFFMPSANNGQIFVVLGYNTGYIRIFTE
ncbi:17106_t:CDS:2, partial [Cetraspora pellucida]